MKVIVISGTPGTGKSTLAKLLAKNLDYQRLDLHHYYKNIASRYNRSKQCYDIDIKKLGKLVSDLKKKGEKKGIKGLVIDSHISHLLPKKLVDLCVVLTCSNLKILQRRLKKRKYSKKKVEENLQAEIFQICLTEAKERKQKAITFDSTLLAKEEILSGVTKKLNKELHDQT